MDEQQLKPEHLVVDIHGKIWIRKARQTTKNMCNIPLLDEMQKILDRYSNMLSSQIIGFTTISVAGIGQNNGLIVPIASYHYSIELNAQLAILRHLQHSLFSVAIG